MNREQFLQNVWRTYPSYLTTQESHVCGRVLFGHDGGLIIRGQQQQAPLPAGIENQFYHPHYGEAIPLSCLREGDVVVYFEKVSSLYLLAPCLLEERFEANMEALRWSRYLDQVKCFFEGRGFVHLKTPYLVSSPGVDHHIDFLTAQGCTSKRQWTLPTSPEIHLKKYLCQGFERLFEIKKCFRDDLDGPQHSVEFSMLEWYRSFDDLTLLKEDVELLLQLLSPNVKKLSEVTVAQCFERHLGFDLTPQTSIGELQSLVDAHGVDRADDDDWNDLFFRIYMEKIEPHLGEDGPQLVSQFPAQQSSLSRVSEDGWSQRFELYWHGIELANAYLEENDPVKNEKVFLREQELRSQKGVPLSEWDQDYFEKLKAGMPPASGIALGLDRLYRLITK